MRSISLVVLLALAVVSPPAMGHGHARAGTDGGLRAAVGGPEATVDAFHAALRRGDTKAAAALLAEDALIFESGGVERSKAEYATHHLPADADFSRAVPSTVTRRSARTFANVAYVASEGRTTGSFNGKALDLSTTETMVLRKFGGRWRIVHIHWSSAKRS